MKLYLLAAAAVLATPALAQTSTMPQSGSSMPDSATPATPADQTPPATDSSMSSSTTMPAPSGTTSTTDSMSTTAPMAPAGTTMTPAGQMGGMMGGAGVAPQPIAAPQPVNPNPPVCRKGQFDGCRNGPGSTHSREVRGR